MTELDDGKGQRFDSAEELFRDLDIRRAGTDRRDPRLSRASSTDLTASNLVTRAECLTDVTNVLGPPPSFRSVSMVATRLVRATLVAAVALTCDITEVAEPPTDSPEPNQESTPHDVFRDLVDRLHSLTTEYLQAHAAYQDLAMAWYERREAESAQGPGSRNNADDLPIAAQVIVESDSPREPELVLADEPLVRVGLLDGPDEYLFSDIVGAARLEDGSVVVVDEDSHEVRMFDAGGGHVWTSGREGEGPGEYRGLRLMRGCPGATVTIYDWNQNRITRLGPDGSVVDMRVLAAVEVNPYNDPTCAPDGDLVFDEWPESEWDDVEAVELGEFYRWKVDLSWEEGDSVVTLATGIPGAERFNVGGGSGPRTWGRDMSFAVTATGVWYGSADDYELEHVDWRGRVTRVARWAGPDLEVTREHLNRYRDAYLARYETTEERRVFERERWPEIRDGLPERFPAYASEGLLSLPDGSVWVVPHPWRNIGGDEFHLLSPGGVWLHRLTIPPGRTLLDAGPGWVLLLEKGEFDEQGVAVYELVEGS